MDLFDRASQSKAAAREPLVERMRPRTLDEFIGQEHLTGPGHFLRRAMESKQIPSLIFWGPPGTGKTTLARVIAGSTGAAFVALSAVNAGVKDIREIVAKAQERWKLHLQPPIPFLAHIPPSTKPPPDPPPPPSSHS